MTTTPNLRYWLIAAAVAIALLAWCNRPPDQPEPSQPDKPARIQNNDSRESAIEAKYQGKLKAQIMASDERDSLRLLQIEELHQKSAQALAEYRKTPTLPNCNTAVNALEQENAQQAVALVECDSAKRVRDRLIWAQTGTITRKSGVIDSLGTGWKAANVALEKAQKPKKWGVGVHLGYGASQHGLSPYVGVGVSYNLIRF